MASINEIVKPPLAHFVNGELQRFAPEFVEIIKTQT